MPDTDTFTPRTHYEFIVPYIHHEEEDWPPQRIVIYPVEELGYVMQYEYDGESMACKSFVNLESAVITARHLMCICCVQGDPDVITAYFHSL